MFNKVTHNLEVLFAKILIVAAFIYIAFEVLELFLILFDVIINYDFKEAVNNLEYQAFEGFIHIFFNILIALEMIETLKTEAYSHVERARLILLICLIALSRKILDFDLKYMNYENIIGLSVLIIAIALGYYVLGVKIFKIKKSK